MTENEVREVFSNNLKRLRKQRGLSQLKLANELQMAMTFINDIENCKKWVSPETLAKFSTFFNVPVADLFLEEKKSKQKQENFVKIISEELHQAIEKTVKRFENG